MKKLIANTRDLGNERQVPVVESLDGGIVVKVGSIEHPMVDKHYIAFIKVLTKDYVIRKDKMCLTLPAKQKR
jgi:superoxide reductase